MNVVTMKLYRGYYDDNNVKFTPTKTQKNIAKEIYEQIIILGDNEKLRFGTKKYKDLYKIFNILDNVYFPHFSLEYSASTDGRNTTYIVKGKAVKKAIFQNRKIEEILKNKVNEIGIIKGQTTQYDAVLMINDYFVNNYKYVDYGEFDVLTYNKLIFTKKTGICQDYAYAFYLLASYCGIKVAQGYSHKGVGHAYNAVRIDGRTTFLDTCWNNKSESPYLFMRKKDFEATDPYHRVDYLAW